MKDEKNRHYHITRFLSTYITGERGLSAPLTPTIM